MPPVGLEKVSSQTHGPNLDYSKSAMPPVSASRKNTTAKAVGVLCGGRILKTHPVNNTVADSIYQAHSNGIIRSNRPGSSDNLS